MNIKTLKTVKMSSHGITIERTNHFQSLIEVFERLLENSALVDCTIAAEGQYLKVHRLMLSACSSYFEVLFSEGNTNPIVILKDIKFVDLKAVIDFIYRGKVQIPASQLQSFVNTIESLHIRGMGNTEQCSSNVETASEGLPVTLLPESRPLTERKEIAVQQEDGNQFGTAALSKKSDVAPSTSEPCPLVEESSVYAQSVKRFGSSQCVEKFGSEIPPKIVECWSECSNEVEDKGDMDSILISDDDDNYAEQLTTELVGQEREETAYVKETPILENYERDAEQFTTEANDKESGHKSTDAATASCEESSAKKLLLLLQRADQDGQVQPYACTQCDKSFSYQRTLIRHQYIHTGQRPYSCTQCPKSFIRKGHLIRHQYTHSEQRPFSCTVCPKSFTTKDYLVVHQRTHTGLRPFSCTECHKSFNVKHTLMEHLRIHRKLRPFSCTLCDKKFTNKSNLTAHHRTHTGQRFSCVNCDKTFSVKHSLKVHQRTHTGQRPFSCDSCDKSYSIKQSLIEHQRTHTKQQPFSCVQCHKLFRYRSSLIVHERAHSGQPRFACAYCHRTFSRKATLVKHLQTHEEK